MTTNDNSRVLGYLLTFRVGGKTHGIGWGSRNYHGGNGRGPAKKAGEQTDYGDYNVRARRAVLSWLQHPIMCLEVFLHLFVCTWVCAYVCADM